MRDRTRRTLASAGRVLRLGGAAALGLGVIVFLFSFLANGLSPRDGLDWVRKITMLLGSLCLIVGGGALLVSGRDWHGGEEGGREDVFRTFGQEIGLHWSVAVTLVSVDFLVVGTVADLLYISLGA